MALTPEQIQRERDRFVAFAFCAADMLIEIESNGAIAYSAGATQALLGCDPKQLGGRQLVDLIVAEERDGFDDLIREASEGKRIDEQLLHFTHDASSAVIVSGYVSRKLKNRAFLAIKPARRSRAGRAALEEREKTEAEGSDAVPATPSAERVAGAERLIDSPRKPLANRPAAAVVEDFGDIVEDKLKALAKGGKDGKLTMLELDGLGAVRNRMDNRSWKQLEGAITGQLQGVSVDGDAAGQMGEGRYGVLHAAGLDVSGLEAEVATIVKEADPTGEGVAVRSSTVDVNAESLQGEDAVKALVYSIQRLADETNANVTIDNLTAGLEDRMQNTVLRIAAVKAAVTEKAFVTAYQPIVYLTDRVIHHYEALVRLDRDKVDMNPFEFITFAEDTGLITDFDMRMCRDVCTRILKALPSGGSVVPVAVNISGRSLQTPAFIESLMAMLRKAPQLQGYLLFEITESARIRDLEEGNRIIQDLRALGYPVCLDDFGAGESAFEYLRALDVDHVKIDGSYIDFAVEDGKGKAFLAAMAGLCRDLDISTIAEKIEDETLIPFLIQCGVEYGQGYYFGKPDPDASPTETVTGREQVWG